MRQKSSGYTYDAFAWQGLNNRKRQAQPGKRLLLHVGGKEKNEEIENWDVHDWANNGMT